MPSKRSQVTRHVQPHPGQPAATAITARHLLDGGRLTTAGNPVHQRTDRTERKEIAVLVIYEPGEDNHHDPLVTEADVTGLYRPEAAAVASQSTTTRIGTENMTDD
jgi:hypothetical protein